MTAPREVSMRVVAYWLRPGSEQPVRLWPMTAGGVCNREAINLRVETPLI